jgi:hypothetical protein
MKDIKQIQEYNYKAIIKSCYSDVEYNEALEDVCSKHNYINDYLTLDRVLLALISKDYINVKQTLDKNILSINGCYWNLTKPTLEEQDHETQMAIYKLLRRKQTT